MPSPARTQKKGSNRVVSHDDWVVRAVEDVMPVISQGVLRLVNPVRELIATYYQTDTRWSLEKLLGEAVKKGEKEAALNQAIGGLVRGSVVHLEEALRLCGGLLDDSAKEEMQSYLIAIVNAADVSPKHLGDNLKLEWLDSLDYESAVLRSGSLVGAYHELLLRHVPLIINKGLEEGISPSKIVSSINENVLKGNPLVVREQYNSVNMFVHAGEEDFLGNALCYALSRVRAGILRLTDRAEELIELYPPRKRISLERALRIAEEHGRVEEAINQPLGGIVRGYFCHLCEALYVVSEMGVLGEDESRTYLKYIADTLRVSPLYPNNSEDELDSHKYEDILSAIGKSKSKAEKVSYVPLAISRGLEEGVRPYVIAVAINAALES